MDRFSRIRSGTVIVVCAVMAVACCGVLHGCSTDATAPTSGRLCTAQFVPGISIRVVDAETGLPAACGTIAVVTAGTYSAAMDDACELSRSWPQESAWLWGAWERPGVYAVSLERPGYRPWSRAGLVVTADECHVQTIELEARLERAE